MTPTIRWATKADIDAFTNLPSYPTIKALVAEMDGRIIGLAGLAFSQGRWVAFCDLSDDMRKYRYVIARSAKRLFEQARRDGIRFIYAEADLNEKGSVRWLTSLGFEIDPRGGRLYRWRGN